MKASNMERTVPVYINFQLTEKRAALAKSVRQAKSDSKVAGYSVDQNGKIKIKKNCVQAVLRQILGSGNGSLLISFSVRVTLARPQGPSSRASTKVHPQ